MVSNMLIPRPPDDEFVEVLVEAFDALGDGRASDVSQPIHE